MEEWADIFFEQGGEGGSGLLFGDAQCCGVCAGVGEGGDGWKLGSMQELDGVGACEGVFSGED